MAQGVNNSDPEARRQSLLAKVEIADDGCWIWTGHRLKNGYGVMRVARRETYVHRISYELHVGPIPPGMVIDHLCSVTACVNPAHLEPVTSAENVMRGRGLCAERARSATCARGHRWDEQEPIIAKGTGHKRCRICLNDWYARRRAQRA